MHATLCNVPIVHNKLLTNSGHLITGGHLLFVTTSEKEIGFLLIQTFKKPINPQNYRARIYFLVAFSYIAGFVRISLFDLL
jgi:hypothetical protein